MDHKIPGKYYLVEVVGLNESGFAIAMYTNGNRHGPKWISQKTGGDITTFVKSYKPLDKIGKMHPFAVLTVKNN